MRAGQGPLFELTAAYMPPLSFVQRAGRYRLLERSGTFNLYLIYRTLSTFRADPLSLCSTRPDSGDPSIVGGAALGT